MLDFDGYITQIDYRQDGSIRKLHLEDDRGEVLTVSIDLPDEPLQEVRIGQLNALFMNGTPRPKVRIEREPAGP